MADFPQTTHKKTVLLPIFRKLLTKICNINLKNIDVNIGYEISEDTQISITIFDKHNTGNCAFNIYDFQTITEIDKNIKELLLLLNRDNFLQLKKTLSYT